MKIWQRHAFIPVCALIATFSACGPTTPTTAQLDDKLYQQISNERQAWNELGIENYQIEIRYSGVWSEFTLILAIKNNKIDLIQATCGEALLDFDGTGCQQLLIQLSPSSYTISKLFNSLMNSRNEYYADSSIDVTPIWSENLRIKFDPKYHYPREIIFLGNPYWSDTQYSTEILDFQVSEK